MSPWTAQYCDAHSCIEIRYEGLVTPADLHGAFKRGVEIGQEHQTLHLLADCRRMERGYSVTDLFGIISAMEKQGMALLLKEALLLPGTPQAAADVEFWVTACRNRGMNVRAFADQESAMAWLDSRAEGRDTR